MHTKNKLAAIAIITSLAGISQPGFAGSTSDRDVVTSGSGQIVRSIAFGTCVRTKWSVGEDACAPEKKEVRKAIAQTVLSSTEKSIYFGFNKASLTDDAKLKLNAVADKLRSGKDVKSADIVGYADRIGSSAYNLKLSKQRAENVKKYLAAKGYLNTNVAQVRGLGESQSITNCGANLSREQAIQCLGADRRVDVEIQYIDAQH